jgi:serine/threonine protein kinase
MHVNFKMIHRDIKPENILLNAPLMKPTVKKNLIWTDADFINNVEIKVCDLGLSKPLEA